MNNNIKSQWMILNYYIYIHIFKSVHMLLFWVCEATKDYYVVIAMLQCSLTHY